MRGQRKLAVLVVIGTFLSSAFVTLATCSGTENDGRPASSRTR